MRQKEAAEKKRRTFQNYLPARFKPTTIETEDGAEIERQYYKLARKADDRLRALEALSHKKGYEGVKNYAYGRAMKDIKYWNGEGAKRFNTQMPKTRQGTLAKMHDMETFLNSPTSLKTGIDNVYKKRVDKINEKYGTDYTWEEFARFLDQKQFEKIKGPSDQILMAIAYLQSDEDAIVEALKRTKQKELNVADLSKAEKDQVIYDILKRRGRVQQFAIEQAKAKARAGKIQPIRPVEKTKSARKSRK